jgi:peptidyl-prolyl cis-trans isomerase SurA
VPGGGADQEARPAPPGRPPGVPAGSVKLKRVVIGLPPNMSKADEQRVLQAAAGLREQIKGCQGLEQFAGQLQGVAVVDLPVLPMSDLAPEVRQVIQGLNPSDVSPPYFSKEGDMNLMNMLVVCGDRPRVDYVATRAFEMPTREEVGNRMFNQELTVMARRYMRDLRRDASIEIRDAAVLNTVSN